MTSSVAAADPDRASYLEFPPAGLREGCCERFPWLLPVVRLPLETVFWFFGGFVAVRSRGRCRLRASGEGLGGVPLPIEHDVSEANSFFLLRFRSNFRVIHRLGLCFKCSVCSCVPRARSLYAPPRKVRNSGLKVRNSGLKVRNSGLKVKQKQLYKSPLKVRNSGLKVKQKQLYKSPLKVRNSTAKVKQKQLDKSLIERS